MQLLSVERPSHYCPLHVQALLTAPNEANTVERLDHCVHQYNSLDIAPKIPLIQELSVILSHNVATSKGLELSEDFSQTFISHVLQATQNTGTEEDLAVSQAIFAGLESHAREKQLTSFSTIHETSWDGFGGKDCIP